MGFSRPDPNLHLALCLIWSFKIQESMSLVDQTKKERFLFIKIESTIINHGGTGNLTLHFLETSNCDCKKFYNGEHDKLVRTSAAPSKLQS